MQRRTMSRVCWGSMLCAGALNAGAAVPGDLEAATHGDQAASHVLVEQETLPNFVFRQYNLAVLSHYSYLVGSGGEAMIVDPDRDTTYYIKEAEVLGLKITRVYLTHSHADFVAGHVELANAVGAKVFVNKDTGAKYAHQPVVDGDEIRFGEVRCVVITTPGHTPDGTCLAIHEPASAGQPRILLTGDTLFIGSVGRPDLMGGTISAAELAEMLYRSWNDKLSKLPDAVKIYPAHGAGSLCGAHLSDDPVSTIGEQRKVNTYLQHKDLNSFIMAVIDGLPEAPQYFKHNAAMNHDGPPAVEWDKGPVAIAPAAVATALKQGAIAVDTRDAGQFAKGHIPGAINIGIRGRFETWVGIMVPWGSQIILVGPEAEVAEASFRLHRIGYDSLAGYLDGGTEAWSKTGLPTQTVAMVKPRDLYDQMQAGTAPIIVDVRLPTEWMGLRIGNVLNLPVNVLDTEAKRLNPRIPVLTVCNSAYRSSMGAGVLQKLGFSNVVNMEGGSEAWIEAGLPTLGATHAGPARAAGIFVNLPERVGARDLAQSLMDLPGSLDVVDIRPDWQFNEYHIPGAINVAVAELLRSPAYLVDKRPLVIVCRDGSISAAAGGALMSKVQRPVRFLAGGMLRYWDEVLQPAGIHMDAVPMAAPPGASPAQPSVSPVPPAAAPPPASPPPTAPKKKSAGC